MKHLRASVAVLAGIALLFGTSACGDSTNGNTTDDGSSSSGEMTLSLELSDNFPASGSDYTWEGWLKLEGQQKPVSTGQFNVQDGKSTYEFPVTTEQVNQAQKFILTLEPAGEPEGTPAATKFLAGALSDDGSTTAKVSVKPAIGTDFSSASGQYFLKTPTNDNSSDYNKGLWFLYPPMNSNNDTNSKISALNLPDLPQGWQYEGWAVKKGSSPQPTTTGTFRNPDGYDSDDAGPNAGKDSDGGQEGPPFPGQDFLKNNGGDGLTLTDGYKAVISVEPKPDNSPKPFVLKPLVDNEINDVQPPETQELSVNNGNFPTIDVSIQ